MREGLSTVGTLMVVVAVVGLLTLIAAVVASPADQAALVAEGTLSQAGSEESAGLDPVDESAWFADTEPGDEVDAEMGSDAEPSDDADVNRDWGDSAGNDHQDAS